MEDLFKAIEAPKAPQVVGPYSQGIITQVLHRMIFVSGQLPIDPETGKLITGDIRAMTKRTLDNMQFVLEAAESNFEYVVRLEIFCTHLKRDFLMINEESSRYFTGPVKPVRQTIQVAELPMDSPIEISCIAIVI